MNLPQTDGCQCGKIRYEDHRNPPARLIADAKVGKGEGFRMPACGDLSARAEGRRPKASQEGTRGGRATACRLFGFDDAAACVVDALASVIGGGSTIAVVSLALRRQSTGRF
jgi:hypothetical protein